MWCVDGIKDGIADGVTDGIVDGIVDGAADGTFGRSTDEYLPMHRCIGRSTGKYVYITKLAGESTYIDTSTSRSISLTRSTGRSALIQ